MTKLNVWELFLQGGYFMWPLLILSVISIIIIIERLVYFTAKKYKFGNSLSETPQKDGNNPLSRIIFHYTSDLSKGEEHAVNVALREASRQIRFHERGLKSLATIGAISPLVGLLGTVWGMVKAFAEMANLGANVTASDFADGIWTGLLTTVAGLLVAIPAVTASRTFESKVDKLNHDINELFSHLKERHFPSGK